MNIKQRRLPSAYQECEGITSSGTQYLLPNIIVGDIGAIELDGNFADAPNYSSWKLDGRGDSGDINRYIGHNYSTTNPKIFIGAYGGDVNTGISMTNYWGVRTKFNLNWVTGKLNINGTDAYTFTPNESTSEIKYSIFAGNGGSGYFQSATKYEYKFWNKRLELIADLISCYRISDNEIGMYDTIGGTFYTNQGSGTFTKGADVVTVDAISVTQGDVIKIQDSLGNVLWSNKPAGALYWYGDECTELTGGWQLLDSYGTLVKASDHMEFSFNTNTAILTTAKQINIENYRTLKAEAMISQGNVGNMDIRFNPDWVRVRLPCFTNQYSIQLKDFIPDTTLWMGMQYIRAVGQYAHTSTGTMLIKRIWLE